MVQKERFLGEIAKFEKNGGLDGGLEPFK